jgi:DNA-binding transcriptional LysR family regulator
MSERLNGIEVFVTAVEAGNFALAAERLRLTRSAVAKSVARLEARLGTRLFHRTTRMQRLTEDGQAYYERCRRALAELDAADAAIDAGRQTPAGRLRITLPTLVGNVLIAPLLLELGRQHAQLTFEVSATDRRVDLIEGGWDLAVRSGVLADSAVLAARLLGHQWIGAFATPAYLDKHGRPASIDDLCTQISAHRFISYAGDGGTHGWRFFDANRQVRDVDMPATFASNNIELNMQAAKAGLGIARLPEWLAAPALASGELVRVFDEATPYGFPLHALWPKARAMPCRLRVLIDELAARIPPLLAPAK